MIRVLYAEDDPNVAAIVRSFFGHFGTDMDLQIVENGRVRVRKVTIGLSAGDRVEIRSGLTEGEQVVARAGTFLREGDAVMPVKAKDEPKVN